MLRESGTVTAVNGAMVSVRIQKRSACSSCAKPCGVGKLGALTADHCVELQLPARGQFHVGEQVEVGLPEAALLQVTLLVYGLPLVGLLAGAIAASAVASMLALVGEGPVLLGAVVGGVAGWAIARYWGRRLEQRSDVQPQLLGPAP